MRKNDYAKTGCERYLRWGKRQRHFARPLFLSHPKRFGCSRCDKVFDQYSSMMRHIQSSCHDPWVYQCPACRSQYADLSSLLQHVESSACTEGVSYGTDSIVKLLHHLWEALGWGIKSSKCCYGTYERAIREKNQRIRRRVLNTVEDAGFEVNMFCFRCEHPDWWHQWTVFCCIIKGSTRLVQGGFVCVWGHNTCLRTLGGMGASWLVWQCISGYSGYGIFYFAVSPFKCQRLSMSTSQKLPNLAPWPVSSTGRTVLSILQVVELIVCPATRSFGIVIALNHSTRQQTDVANRR